MALRDPIVVYNAADNVEAHLLRNAWYGTAAANVVGLLGLMCFWRPARWMMVGVLASSVVGPLFMGLAVYSPVENALGLASFAINVWLVTVSFGSSSAPYFGPSTLQGRR